MSAKTHLACTRASVSTHAAASNASVAPDTQVALFFFTPSSDEEINTRVSESLSRPVGWTVLRQPRRRSDSE